MEGKEEGKGQSHEEEEKERESGMEEEPRGP